MSKHEEDKQSSSNGNLLTLMILQSCSWRRIVKNGRPGRTSFAPWTTLALRYLVLCFAVSNSFVAWSTTMPSVASCKVSSGFLIASGDVLNAGIAFAIAWRAQAVARGVIQSRNKIRLMQFFIALLVVSDCRPHIEGYLSFDIIFASFSFRLPKLSSSSSVPLGQAFEIHIGDHIYNLVGA